MIDLSKLEELAKNKEQENKKFLKKLRAKKPKNLDSVVHNLHDEVFEHTDCLECANCCKTLGPRITDKDIKRLSKHLKLSEEKFINQYLKIDEDNDYVFAAMPCPFLMPDNYCMIYENRPKACREYPHTDSRKFYKLLNITQKNASTCPAVYEIIEGLKEEYISKK